MIIIDYKNSNNMLVLFENGYKTSVSYSNFVKGNVKNPYDKSVCGVGFIGEGEYSNSKDKNRSPQYSRWNSMLGRCYSDSFLKKKPTYKSCEVCEEWHNFQNFAKWYDDNYYEIFGEKMSLDKDILVKGNKIYSPDTCVFVPQPINSLFEKSNKTRGKFLIGVFIFKNKNRIKRFSSTIVDPKSKVKINLGYFMTENEAFLAYKKAKESAISFIANKYKESIPEKLYKAMIDYKVEKSD